MSVLLMQVATTTLTSQVIIRDTVYIAPHPSTPSSAVASAVSIFRVEFSYTGVVDQSFAGYNILVAAHRYCPISQQVSLNSGQGAVEVEAAAGGWYNVRARMAFPYGSTGVAKLVYRLDGEVLQVDSTVITCTNIAGCAIDWRPTVVLYPGMTVVTGSGSILHGQSTTLSVSPVASPFFCARGGEVWHPGYPATVSIVAGSSYGSFVDVNTGQSLGTSFRRKVAQLNTVRYVANGEQPLGEHDTVKIQAEANGVMGLRSIIVRRSAPQPSVTITHPARDTTIVLTQDHQPVITLQETHTPGPGQQHEPVISWEPSRVIDTRNYFDQIMDSLVIVARVTATSEGGVARDSVRITLKKEVLDHFVVRVEPDTVAFTETAKIYVQAKDASDNDIDLPVDTKVNIVLRADERYGNLAYGSQVGKTITDVPYTEAKAGAVLFAATGENPIGLEPQKVQIGVTGAGKEGIGRVWVKCKVQPPRYAQGGGDWADDIYDHTDKKISALGCALSSMAMVMTAFGDTVNPGKLNRFMKDSSGYNERSVKWSTIEKHSGDRVIIFDYVKNGDFPDSTKATNPAVLENHLAVCNLAIVKVFNDRTGNEHWIVITGKKDNTYTILDPGRGETTLNGYGGRFWSYVIVGKSK